MSNDSKYKQNQQQQTGFGFEWREFLCGWGAAFFNIGITYPIHKMIFRQVLHDLPLSSAFKEIRYEGIGYMYRGICPPLAQKSISLSIMFGVYDGTRRALIDKCGMGEKSAQAVAGLVSGSFEAVLLPFERVQTLLADNKYHNKFRNMPECFKYVYINHGVSEMFRAMVPVLWRNGPSNAMFFICREAASKHLPKRESVSMRTFQEFMAGATIGAALSALFYPINVIKVSMQSDMGHPYEGMFAAIRRIYKERGYSVQKIYRGCGFNSIRSFLSWGIMNTAYENIKKVLYKI